MSDWTEIPNFANLDHACHFVNKLADIPSRFDRYLTELDRLSTDVRIGCWIGLETDSILEIPERKEAA